VSVLAGFDVLRQEPLHNLRELAFALEMFPNPHGDQGRCERGQVILRQGERLEKVLFLVGKTQARLLREVVVEREPRVVEAGAVRAPGIANECCVQMQSGRERHAPRSTVLISNPGEIWSMDRYLFKKKVSNRSMHEQDEGGI